MGVWHTVPVVLVNAVLTEVQQVCILFDFATGGSMAKIIMLAALCCAFVGCKTAGALEPKNSARSFVTVKSAGPIQQQGAAARANNKPKPTPTPVCPDDRFWVKGELSEVGHITIYATKDKQLPNALFVGEVRQTFRACPQDLTQIYPNCRRAEFTGRMPGESFEMTIRNTRYSFSGFGSEGETVNLCAQ